MTITGTTLPSKAPPPRRTMWNGTVRALPLPDQLEATRLAGCTALSVTPYDVHRWTASGISVTDMLAMADNADVRITHLDPLVRWTEDWRPVLPDGGFFPVDTVAFDLDEFLRMAAALELESFTAFAGFAPGRYTELQMIDAFGRLCDRAGEEDLRCDLEFITVWGIPDLRTAWTVIEGSGRANCGIVLDFWNYLRGARDDELLATIPGERITGVQICDGTAVIAPGISPVEDALFHRRVPGEGEWPIDDILDVLRLSGGLNNVGLEVFSTQFDAMPADEIGRRTRAALDAVLLPREPCLQREEVRS